MKQKIGYYPENSGSYSLPVGEARIFAGEELKPGDENTVDDGWWNAYCVPGHEVFVMSRYGVLRLLKTIAEPTEAPEEDQSKKQERQKRSPKVQTVEPVLTLKPDPNFEPPLLQPSVTDKD